MLKNSHSKSIKIIKNSLNSNNKKNTSINRFANNSTLFNSNLLNAKNKK